VIALRLHLAQMHDIDRTFGQILETGFLLAECDFRRRPLAVRVEVEIHRRTPVVLRKERGELHVAGAPRANAAVHGLRLISRGKRANTFAPTSAGARPLYGRSAAPRSAASTIGPRSNATTCSLPGALSSRRAKGKDRRTLSPARQRRRISR
jgi:hypothetical protein